MPEWYDLTYDDIKDELDPALREVHERLIALIRAKAKAREPGLTDEEYDRRVAEYRKRRRRELAEGQRSGQPYEPARKRESDRA